MQRDSSTLSEQARGTPILTDALKVCFVRTNAIGLFDPRSTRPYGGAEVRSFLFATGLARRAGFAVSFLIGDEGQPRRQQIGDVAVHVLPTTFFEHVAIFFDHVYGDYRQYVDSTPHFPWVGLSRWRPSLLWQIPTLAIHRLFMAVTKPLRALLFPTSPQYDPKPRNLLLKLEVDMFCCFGANSETAEVIAASKRRKRRTILCLIHDEEVADLNRHGGVNPTMQVPTDIIRYCLSNADGIVVQSAHQREQLRRHFGRDAVVIRNPIDLTEEAGTVAAPAGKYVLWIGRTTVPDVIHKRPELCWALARLCPEVPIFAILNPSNPNEFARLMAEKPDNVRVVEQVPYSDMDKIFASARLFLSTSASEGFPNTFLQAAKHRVPILSLAVDPDGMLSREGAGLVCGDNLSDAATAMRRLWGCPLEAAEIGSRGRAYLEREHDLQQCVDRLANLLIRVRTGEV